MRSAPSTPASSKSASSRWNGSKFAGLMQSRVDWLLPAVLSVTAGAVDAIVFLALGGLFTAHITGNAVILAAALCHRRLQRSRSAIICARVHRRTRRSDICLERARRCRTFTAANAACRASSPAGLLPGVRRLVRPLRQSRRTDGGFRGTSTQAGARTEDSVVHQTTAIEGGVEFDI